MRLLFDLLGRVVDAITSLLMVGAGVALFGVLGVNLVGVVMRYIVRSPIRFSVEMPSLLLLLIIGLALAYAQKGKAHVQVTTLTMHLPAAARNILSFVTSLFFLAYVAFIAWATWQEARVLLKDGIRSIEAHIPLFLPVMLIPIGLGVFCLQIVADICRAFRTPGDANTASPGPSVEKTVAPAAKDN